MSLKLPENSNIVGNWNVIDGTVIRDSNCQRVHELIENYLQKLGTSNDGWSTLFRDPEDGRLWERQYLQGEMHGGGPPSLMVITADAAQTKYGNF